MKKFIVILLSVVLLTACGSKTETNKIVVTSRMETPVEKTTFNNPTFIAGSSFGEFFVSMLRTQNYDMALKFVSKGSIEKYGLDKVKDRLESFQYNYKLAQRSIVKQGDTLTLQYSTNEYATGKFKKMIIVVENDSCKLVLPDNEGLFSK
jgi:hypothetical protein